MSYPVKPTSFGLEGRLVCPGLSSSVSLFSVSVSLFLSSFFLAWPRRRTALPLEIRRHDSRTNSMKNKMISGRTSDLESLVDKIPRLSGSLQVLPPFDWISCLVFCNRMLRVSLSGFYPSWLPPRRVLRLSRGRTHGNCVGGFGAPHCPSPAFLGPTRAGMFWALLRIACKAAMPLLEERPAAEHLVSLSFPLSPLPGSAPPFPPPLPSPLCLSCIKGFRQRYQKRHRSWV